MKNKKKITLVPAIILTLILTIVSIIMLNTNRANADTGYYIDPDDGQLKQCDHNGTGTTTVIATCKTSGGTICSRCSTYITNTGTNPNNHANLVHHDAKSSTCIEEGYEAYDECSACGYVSEHKTLEKSGHSPVNITEAVSPTCTTTGTTPFIKCSTCGQTLNSSTSIPALGHKYDKEDGTKNIVDYKRAATQHTPVAKCIRCTETKELTAEAHAGATHPDGKCTVCGQVYQTHGKGTASYTTTATQHTPTYKCSFSGCTATYAGTAEAHKGATHPDGKCTICKYQYQKHNKGAFDSYTATTTGHTPVYKCTYSGCTEKITGTAEAHTGATHPDGKCTVCGQVYQTHSKGDIDSYTKTTTGHTPIYKCSYSGCTETYTGTAEAHTIASWKDNKDGTHSGDCTTCQYTVTASHTFSNGECTVCKAKQSITPENCTHNYEIQSDETSHWEKCKICQKETTKSAHNITTWTDKKDGKHEGTCTVCKKVITEAHTDGTNGKCKKCSYDGTPNGNNNGNNNSGNNNNGGSNNNGNNNSGNNNNGNNGSGNNNNGNNSNNGGSNSGTNGKDNTTAKGSIPQTGSTPVFITTVITTIGVAGFAVYKMKKLKDVK